MPNLPKYRDLNHEGRIRGWSRLAPEYNEQLHIARRDLSNSRSFVDTLQFFFNWKIWKGLYLQKTPTWDRWASCHMACPLAYKLTYDFHGMGQNHYSFEFWFLNVLYLKWFRSRRIDSKVAVRFKQRFGKEVFKYAYIQVKDEDEKRKQAQTVSR